MLMHTHSDGLRHAAQLAHKNSYRSAAQLGTLNQHAIPRGPYSLLWAMHPLGPIKPHLIMIRHKAPTVSSYYEACKFKEHPKPYTQPKRGQGLDRSQSWRLRRRSCLSSFYLFYNQSLGSAECWLGAEQKALEEQVEPFPFPARYPVQSIAHQPVSSFIAQACAGRAASSSTWCRFGTTAWNMSRGDSTTCRAEAMRC